jgi:hypothetical protein
MFTSLAFPAIAKLPRNPGTCVRAQVLRYLNVVIISGQACQCHGDLI